MTTILIGRKELFSFADRYSAGRLIDYSGLGDGEVLCCLFSLVFPELRIRPAPSETHSSTQRTHANWEVLFRRFARLHIPLAFLNQRALQAGEAECGFSTLVLFYFMHNLSKRADFAAEFALDVADEVTAYLQSTACIVTLLLGNALDWAAVPPALVPTLRQHPAFRMAEAEVAALEAAAARTYRVTYVRPRCRSRTAQQQLQQPRRRRTWSATGHADNCATADELRGSRPRLPEAGAAASDSSRSRSASSCASHPGAEEDGTLNTPVEEDNSPMPRPPQGSTSSYASASHTTRTTPPPAPPLHTRPRSCERAPAAVQRHGAASLLQRLPVPLADRRGPVIASSAPSSVASSSSFTNAARTSTSRGSKTSASRASSSAGSASRASSLGGSTAYAASGSARGNDVAPLYRSAASVRPAPVSDAAAVRELEEALQRKEAECEGLQLRVAQLLAQLADARAVASGTACCEARIAELEAQVRDAEAERAHREALRSPCPSSHAAAPIDKAALEAEIAALAADVLQPPEENGAAGGAAAGTRIDVHETANLLHCLMLEQLHDAPRNRVQMQQWLWSIVEAHHTLEGRLMAAVDLLRVWSASLDSSCDGSDGRAASASTARRSASTVAASFPAATRPRGDTGPKTTAAEDEFSMDRLASVRGAHVAELEALHAREHALRTALESAQSQHAATVQRAVRRERLWKALCASVYAAEQASFAITECSTAEQVEARLRERERHYGTVESVTQQLVEEGPHETAEGVTAPEGAAAVRSPCASMQALMQRLQEERDELLAGVAQMHAALSRTQQGPQQHDAAAWTREQPVKSTAATREAAPATAAASDVAPWTASFPHTSPDVSRRLSALLHAGGM